jgi:LruC domain-containing protein
MVDQVKATFVIRAFGATYHNGFGFQLPAAISPSDLSVSGYHLTKHYITLSANGTEAGQSKPTIIVYDDAYSEMQHPGTGIGVNTDPAAPYVSPVTLLITIDFPSNTYSYNDLDIANFNPFIIVDQNRGVEVHLPDYPPTNLANPALLGTDDDDSNPASGKYYKTVNNLPWAINIYEQFDYPIEKADITRAHLHFVQWATSNGQQYPDWYQNKPGYRNPALIY